MSYNIITLPKEQYALNHKYWYFYANSGQINLYYFNNYRLSGGGSYGRYPEFRIGELDGFTILKSSCKWKLNSYIDHNSPNSYNGTDMQRPFNTFITNCQDMIDKYNRENPSQAHKFEFSNATPESVFNRLATDWGWNCRAEEPEPQPPTPGGGGETDKPCSNTGQFGGGGTPLKDIKLFLYANKVTKGTIKLSKPQVEVGTFATDWRPNPSDYVHVNNSNFKRINGIAMQHSDVSGKTFLEIQAKDGTVFGIDTWRGTQKLLEQQQAEIEELKKLVQTLETKINV